MQRFGSPLRVPVLYPLRGGLLTHICMPVANDGAPVNTPLCSTPYEVPLSPPLPSQILTMAPGLTQLEIVPFRPLLPPVRSPSHPLSPPRYWRWHPASPSSRSFSSAPFYPCEAALSPLLPSQVLTMALGLTQLEIVPFRPLLPPVRSPSHPLSPPRYWRWHPASPSSRSFPSAPFYSLWGRPLTPSPLPGTDDGTRPHPARDRSLPPPSTPCEAALSPPLPSQVLTMAPGLTQLEIVPFRPLLPPVRSPSHPLSPPRYWRWLPASPSSRSFPSASLPTTRRRAAWTSSIPTTRTTSSSSPVRRCVPSLATSRCPPRASWRRARGRCWSTTTSRSDPLTSGSYECVCRR